MYPMHVYHVLNNIFLEECKYFLVPSLESVETHPFYMYFIIINKCKQKLVSNESLIALVRNYIG